MTLRGCVCYDRMPWTYYFLSLFTCPCYGMLTFYLLFTIFCILCNQVMTPSLHVMARKYSHVMICYMSDCVVLVDQACDESCG